MRGKRYRHNTMSDKEHARWKHAARRLRERAEAHGDDEGGAFGSFMLSKRAELYEAALTSDEHADLVRELERVIRAESIAARKQEEARAAVDEAKALRVTLGIDDKLLRIGITM